MANLSPERAAEKWARNLSASTQDIAAGVGNVTQAPGVAAARARQAWLAKTTAAADKWARNVAAVSLDEWKSKMTSVGIPRIAQGAEANKSKMAAFAQDFYPHLDRGVAAVKAMPNNTLEDGIARATAMIRHNAQFKNTRKG